MESLDYLLSTLSFIPIIIGVITFVYWARLIFYVAYKKPKFWDQMYHLKMFPKGDKFFSFYLGKEDFGDKKIKYLKRKFRMFFLLSIASFIGLIIIGILSILFVQLIT